MTMLKKANWVADEYRYEVAITHDEARSVLFDGEVDDDETYRRTAFFDKRTKSWIVQIIDSNGCQEGSAEFYANKRTFVY